MIRSIRQAPLRLFLAVAVCGLMTVTDLPSASPVHAQEQAVTATRNATGESPPARPTDLQASAEPDSVSLTWTASTDQTVTHYAVLRRDRNRADAGVFKVIDGNAGSGLSYTDRSVSPEDSYVYRMKAVSPTGVSQWSSYARADIPTEEDLAPSGLSAKFVSGDDGVIEEVALAWDAPAEDAASVTGYEILRAVGDGDLATLVANTGSADTTYTDDTATKAGESYAYRVKALRGEEASQPSDRAVAIIPEVTVSPSEPRIAEEQNVAIWSATLTIKSLGSSGILGCSNANSGTDLKCSTNLTDTTFSYDNTNYTVDYLYLNTGQLWFGVRTNTTDKTVADLVLNIGGTAFALADAAVSGPDIAWSNSGLSWTADSDVSVTLTKSASDDATLSALSLSGVTLSPSFAADTLTYTASVGNAVTSTTVTATANDDGATVAIVPADADDTADGHQVALAVGDTAVSVTVTAEDGTTTQTYAVTVTRAEAVEQDTALWSATLTVAVFGSGSYGCSNDISGKECSSLLAPDDFTYNGTTYQITGLATEPGALYIEFLNELGEDAVDSFVLNAVGDTFSFQTPDAIRVDKATVWLRDINAWDDGDVVSVSITVSGAEADEPAEGTTEGTTVSADWGLIPSGLNAGDRFRLLFRTSTTRDATSTDIADYDAFVQTAASNGHADIRSHGAAFRVLGSTADVDARDNTTTTYTADDKGVAVYWLNGNKVADDYEDFYDGTWSNADGGKDEDGNAHTAPQVGTTDGTYTGSNSDGTKATHIGTSRALGTSNVRVGRPLGNANANNAGSSATGPFYGLSGVFVVGEDVEVPETWSLIPSGLGAGDRFRLIFLSSTDRQAKTTNITDYNSWIQTRAAAGHADIRRSSSLFRAVGSTSFVGARDNTSTTYTDDDKGVPIYWLGGNKVADDYADFYDGAWDDEANAKDESGTDRSTSTDADLPYTGSAHDGTLGYDDQGISRALGLLTTWVGQPNTAGSTNGPLSSDLDIDFNERHPLYGLSAVFRVTPAEELVETTVPPDWSLVPSDLGAGDSFRLLFIGSTQRNASDSDIGVYNTFVQNLVTISGHADIRDHSSTFRMLGSTEAVDARDNTATTYTADDTGVPIYWLGGNKVADDYADFYDGDWDEEASGAGENGDSVDIPDTRKIWTGSAQDGTEAMLSGTSRALGNSGNNFVMQGSPNGNDSAHGPIESNTTSRSTNRGVYGLSGVFVVSTPITGDFDLHDDNGDPRGVWGNDDTIWVSNSLCHERVAREVA